MEIHISNSSGIPIYEQLVTQIKNLILNGALQDGEALPSMRLLAKELRISVITQPSGPMKNWSGRDFYVPWWEKEAL